MNLLEILSKMPKGPSLAKLDDQLVELLSSLTETEPNYGNRIESNLDKLKKVLKGVEDGYNGKKSDESSDHYKLGNAQGVILWFYTKKARESGNPQLSEQYRVRYNQLKKVLSDFVEEFETLKQAKKSPYKFLSSQIGKDYGMHGVISDGLVEILGYKGIAEELFHGNLDDNAVKAMEKKKGLEFDDRLKLGIAYLSRGDLESAQYQFNHAVIMSPRLSGPIKAVSSNILIANAMLSPIYHTARLAGEFESGGSRLKL